MVSISYGLAWVLLLSAAVGFASLSVRINRRDAFLGRTSLLASWSLTSVLLVGVTVLSVLTRLDIFPILQVIVFALSAGAALTMPLAWLRFALQYTGQRFPTGRWTFIRLGLPVGVTFAVIVLTLGLGFLNFGLGLDFLSEPVLTVLPVIIDYVTAMAAFYLAALLVVGASIIAWTTYSFRHLPNEGGVLLGIGAILPWAALMVPEATAMFEGFPLVGVYHVTTGAVVGLVAVVAAVERFDLLSQVPAAGTVGRDVTVDQMEDPVIVTDEVGRLIDLNPAAEDAFQISLGAIGRPLDALLDGVELDELVDRGAGDEIARGGRTFETSASVLRDEYERVLGYTLVFHDVTDRQLREQRIQVLNRVLRHNLRNDLNVVNGYAELLEQETSEGQEYAVQIQEVAAELLSIGEKAREIEGIVADQRETRRSSVRDAVENAVEEADEDLDGCSISLQLEGGEQEVNAPVLTSIVKELIDNGCRHNDAEAPRVVVETMTSNGEYPVSIRVTDNGPGIPEHELSPLREGSETALEHGSGLGLWLINWGVATLNGEFEFESNPSGGSMATLRLPSR